MWVHVQKTKLKETVLWGTITWSEMGEQNIQAKKVWSITIESILVFLSYLIFLANLCEEFNVKPVIRRSFFPFCFVGLIAGYARFEKQSPRLSKKAKPSVILVVVVVKWAYRAKGLLL